MVKGLLRKRWLQLALASVGVPLLVYAFSSGPPSQHTGGFGEPTCTECHVGTSGPGSVTITAPATYASGQTYQIMVRVADPNQRRWGFELSARRQAANQQAGTLTATPGQTQLVPTFNGIQYMTHLSAPTTAVGAGFTFAFDWQAPDISAGPVVFHAAGNAANGTGSESGDRIYTTSAVSQPGAPGPAPTLFDGGTVNAASFVAHPNAVAPGSIVAIFGSDLTQGGQSAPNSFFGSNGRLSTFLVGAGVTMNGIAAPLFAAFPGQINAQVPFELAGQTSASVQVTVAGQASVTRTVFLDSTGPGIFLVPTQVSATQGAILNASDASFAAAAGSVPGRTARPARRGQD
ncbi:MAG TPA: choice-of-anchor V domain-containing protein, partial [Terriglobia bacterium]